MPPDSKQTGRVVFVGNIPYGLTEEQIVHTFSTVGKVTSFRLVYDRETGRPKGFGFAEYQDADSAASAVRNLNDHDVMGRKLRVDFSNDGGSDDAAPPGYVPQPPLPPNGAGLPPPPMPIPTSQTTTLPPLPPGVDLPPGLTSPDAISRTLSTLPAPQLLDILAQMKGLVMADPNKATELLKQAPQLSYAIFQALLLMGLVDASALQSVIEQSASQPTQAAAAAPMAPAPPPQAPYQPYAPQLGQMQVPTPPTHGSAYPPPPLPVQPVQPAPAPAAAGLDKTALFQYVLNLTPEQLNAMQPGEREQLVAVRQSILSGALRL
ncbi:MAG: hypothetical protein M1832_001499 [Thelocarpon impressellum]|nr:MAG: hypothetical protein M1832_001499 [Thelocarpon impressellum]